MPPRTLKNQNRIRIADKSTAMRRNPTGAPDPVAQHALLLHPAKPVPDHHREDQGIVGRSGGLRGSDEDQDVPADQRIVAAEIQHFETSPVARRRPARIET